MTPASIRSWTCVRTEINERGAAGTAKRHSEYVSRALLLKTIGPVAAAGLTVAFGGNHYRMPWMGEQEFSELAWIIGYCAARMMESKWGSERVLLPMQLDRMKCHARNEMPEQMRLHLRWSIAIRERPRKTRRRD